MNISIKPVRKLDLQAKVTLVLLAVMLPTFLIVTVAQNSLTKPLLLEEMRQIGITSSKTLAAVIVSARLFTLKDPSVAIDRQIQEVAYAQPNIVRIDVAIKDPATGVAKTIASNVEEEPGQSLPIIPLAETVTTEMKRDKDTGHHYWEISVPIEQISRDPKVPKKILGTVRTMVSLQLVGRLADAVWKITATAAVFSVVMLLLALVYFLRKTISNERLLRQAEDTNIQLTAQLNDAQRQIMNTEKLAVMGQLTASFAHEIGTPLNAIGGHLQLLKEELSAVIPAPAVAIGAVASSSMVDRLEIINGQVNKIEEIVKGFLQNTANPPSQKQLVDLNQLVEKTLRLIEPRSESEGIEIRKYLNRNIGPIRVVPLDLEQIFLNLFNNSLDSIATKKKKNLGGFPWVNRLSLEVTSRSVKIEARDWAEVIVHDTGEGIRKIDLANVLKPFFTTKGPGQGTGLGLTICQQLVHKYGGHLEIESKEGVWTRVTLKIPYHV